MGKSKSRIFRKGINNQIPRITRQEAVLKVVEFLNNYDIQAASNIVTMFGLNAEEILEAGADYEAVISIRNILNDN